MRQSMRRRQGKDKRAKLPRAGCGACGEVWL